MSTDLVTIERNLGAIRESLQEVLSRDMDVSRLIRTVVVSIERNPRLMNCTQQSILRSAMTAAVLGLEVDGVSGQGYLVPYGDVAQFQVGYKGYNTMGARSGYTITGDVVREGDEFDYAKGTSAFVRHKPAVKGGGRITGAWAAATHKTRPPVVEYMPLDELLAVKARSPAVKQNKKDSPWFDDAIGFPAMCTKTVKRRLSRSMPLNVMQWGAAVDEAYEERGLAAHVTPEGPVIIEGEASPLPPRDQEQEQLPTGEPGLPGAETVYRVTLADGNERRFMSASEWSGFMQMGFGKIDKVGRLESFWRRNTDNWSDVNEVEPEVAETTYQAYQQRRKDLTPDNEGCMDSQPLGKKRTTPQ